jgi:RNA polymerase sigma factor (sigma-70 family)
LVTSLQALRGDYGPLYFYLKKFEQRRMVQVSIDKNVKKCYGQKLNCTFTIRHILLQLYPKKEKKMSTKIATEKTMRVYQENVFDVLVDFVQASLKKRFASGFIIMPPRSGKTLIFTELIRRLSLRTIIVSPTLMILQQNYKEMKSQNPSARISMYADSGKDLSGDIIFTTYHSLVYLAKRGVLSRDFAHIIIFDEVHRSLSLERSKLPEYFDAIFLGFTATDKFSEEKNVERIFKNELYRMPIQEAIEDGILLPLRGVIVNTSIDLREYQLSRQNALDEKVAERLLNIEARNKVAKEYYLENLNGVPAVAFCVSIEHTINLAAYFRLAGIRAEAIHSRVDSKNRHRIIEAFNASELDVLCSRDILIEGWDSARVTAELNLRPTYSWVLAEQRACRVLTPSPGKESGLVVEFQDLYRQGDQPILIHHLFGERHYRQGGYVLAPQKKRLEEEAKIEAQQSVIVLGDLKVSSEVRTVIEIGRIDVDVQLTIDLIRGILASRMELTEYILIELDEFRKLQFEHPKFQRGGETLLKNYFGILWQCSVDLFEVFKQEVLEEEIANYYLVNSHNLDFVQLLDPHQLTVELELKEKVAEILSTLTPRQEKIIKMRFGIGQDRDHSLREIGLDFEVTGNRISQLEAKALRKLRHPSRSRRLKDFAD